MRHQIRQATIADTDTIAALAAALNAHFGVTEPAYSGSALRPAMTGDDPLMTGYLAEADGAAIGYALCQKFFDTDTGTMATWLLDLYVSPEHRSEGLGRKLIAHVAAEAAARGQRCIGLAVYHDNPARRLYERLGAALPSDALVYELRDQNLNKLAREAQKQPHETP